MKILKEVSLADSLSVLNALLGFSAIVNSMLYGLSDTSFALFYFSLIIDGLDGFIASKTEKSILGKELDSLADTISFGVFPAVALVEFNPNSFPFASLLIASTILRLARFNVLRVEDFIGIPTSVNSLLITSLIRLKLDIIIINSVALLSSILMISDFSYIRIKNKILFAIAIIVLILAINFRVLCYLIVFACVLYILFPKEVIRWMRREKLLLKSE